jgi:hypothetical protein
MNGRQPPAAAKTKTTHQGPMVHRGKQDMATRRRNQTEQRQQGHCQEEDDTTSEMVKRAQGSFQPMTVQLCANCPLSSNTRKLPQILNTHVDVRRIRFHTPIYLTVFNSRLPFAPGGAMHTCASILFFALVPGARCQVLGPTGSYWVLLGPTGS